MARPAYLTVEEMEAVERQLEVMRFRKWAAQYIPDNGSNDWMHKVRYWLDVMEALYG